MNRNSGNLFFEIGFYIKSRFSAGNSDLLYRPSFVSYESDDDYDLIGVDVCIGNLTELIRYYESLFACIEKYEEPYPQNHFWLRPGIFFGDEPVFSFSWFDKLVDSERMYHELKDSEDEIPYSTGDQGWYFAIQRLDDRLLFYESSDEEAEITFSDFQDKLINAGKKYHFETDEDDFVDDTWAWEYRDLFLNQMEQKIAVARKVIAELTAHFGVDHWSNYSLRKN